MALKDKWLGPKPGATSETLLAIAIALNLVAALLASVAVRRFELRVTASDYFQLEDELQRLARLPSRITGVALAITVAATALTAGVVL